MSINAQPTRLLLLLLKEPVDSSGRKLADNSADALHRYRALVTVLFRQLRRMRDCRIRICYEPSDAEEAIKFWILPQLEEVKCAQDNSYSWIHAEGGIDFRAFGEEVFG